VWSEKEKREILPVPHAGNGSKDSIFVVVVLGYYKVTFICHCQNRFSEKEISFLFFEAGCHCVAQAGLKFTILLS
jgi:hypothetical protein